MARKVYVSLLILVGVALALAGPAAGHVKASFAGAGAYSIDAAVQQLTSASKLEDGVAPELTLDLEVHRRILAGNIAYRALMPQMPSCSGPCPPRGGAYTGRGCKSAYGCKQG